MKSDVLEKPNLIKSPAGLAVPQEQAPSGRAYALLLAKHVVFTVGFVLFCIASIVGMVYFTALFQNTSYKMVVFFLALITISNVTGKYVIWCIEH